MGLGKIRPPCLVTLALLAACTGSARTLPRPKPPEPTDESAAEIKAWNARARAGAVTYSVHGVTIEDPYRALEEDSELTRGWIDAQTKRTERALSRYADPTIESRLEAFLEIGDLSDVSVGGTRVVVAKREGDREQAALYLMQDGALSREPLIDPASYGPRAALDWFYASPAGRYVAFGISENGDERSVLRVLDIESRRLLPEAIAHAKWCTLSWLNDESGFYYTRYPAQGEARFDEAEPDTYFPGIFFHRLAEPRRGDPSGAGDSLLFQSPQGNDFPAVDVSEDDRFVVVTNYHGWTASDVYTFDRRAAAGDVPKDVESLRRLAMPEDSRNSAVVHRGRLYVLTNADAPRWRIIAFDVARDGRTDRNPAVQEATTVVAESTGAIEDFVLVGDRLAVLYVEDVSSQIRLFTLDGAPAGAVALPSRGSVGALSAARAGGPLVFTFSSFFHPPTLYRFDPDSARLSQQYQVAHDLDLPAFALSQTKVRSADGTEVNVYYVHRKGLSFNRDNPVLLYGYGGFDVSLLPSFTRNALYWLERGGVYAVANLRGGGEFGEAWHKAGMLENKKRVFEDFEAVLAWLSDSGLSRPERIAITGGSNGGLLVGAMLTRAPGRFAAAAAYVGLYDMLRYPLFPPARLWISEYGDPSDASAARYLRAYSPYHHVVPGAFPAVLIETADHDTRVFWGHSTKFAALLQSAQRGPRPIYFYMQRDQGHGRGTLHSDQVRKLVRRYAFLEAALGMR